MDLDPSIIKQQIVRKTLIPADLCLFWTVKNYVNVPSKVISRKKFVFVDLLKINNKNSRIRMRIWSISQMHGYGSGSSLKWHGSACATLNWKSQKESQIGRNQCFPY
jgi:hypothetical protein